LLCSLGFRPITDGPYDEKCFNETPGTEQTGYKRSIGLIFHTEKCAGFSDPGQSHLNCFDAGIDGKDTFLQRLADPVGHVDGALWDDPSALRAAVPEEDDGQEFFGQ
jgi:hypothetical protein